MENSPIQSSSTGKKIIPFDNRFYRTWYLRKLYFKIIKTQVLKIGLKNTIITQFPFTFPDASRPPSLSLEFTNLCNLKCTYCTSPHKERQSGLMKQQTLERIVEDIAQFKIPRVRIVGNGEPTIHPQLREYLSLLKKVTPVVTLTTNGNFIKERVVQDIIDTGVDQINISVDGHTKKTYEKYRLGGHFEKLVENLRLLKRYRDQHKSKSIINIRVMISPDEFEQIAEINAFWQPYADVVSRQYIINANEKLENDTFETNSHTDRFPKCSLPFKVLDINWNGNVPLCTYSIKQSGIKDGVLLGNINHQNLQQIWNHPLITQYRNAHRKRVEGSMPLCKGCWGT